MISLNAEQLLLIWHFIRSLVIFFPITFFGAFLSNLLHEAGVFARIEPHLRPVVKYFKLPTFLLPAIASSLVNLRLEHVIIYSFYSKGLLSDRFIIYYNLLMSPLRHINIMICYLIPISLPTLGLYAGSLYIMLLYIKSILVSLLGITYRLLLIKKEITTQIVNIEELKPYKQLTQKISMRQLLFNSLKYSLKILKKLSIRFSIIMSIMLILTVLGVFQLLNDYLTQLLKPILQQYNLKSELISVIVIATVYPMIAPFIAGSFLTSNVLSVKEVLIGLLLGGMLFMIFFDFTRHSFPFYASIYPIRVAVKLSLSLIIASMITTPMVILIVFVLPI